MLRGVTVDSLTGAPVNFEVSLLVAIEVEATHHHRCGDGPFVDCAEYRLSIELELSRASYMDGENGRV